MHGGLNAKLTVQGVHIHSAYPHLGDSPAYRIVRMLDDLIGTELDKGNEWFPATNLQVTTIDVGNPATNVTPATARAGFNIRFNNNHNSADLKKWMKERCDAFGGRYELDVYVSGEAFLTQPAPLSSLVSDAVKDATGRTPVLSTTGGTSDARFICRHRPLVEFGLINRTIHQVKECTAAADLPRLTNIYGRILVRFLVPSLPNLAP